MSPPGGPSRRGLTSPNETAKKESMKENHFHDVIIAGDKLWSHVAPIKQRLLKLRRLYGKLRIVNCGGKEGADAIVRQLCVDFEIPYVSIKANWSKDGKKQAAPLRNQLILEQYDIKLLLVFHANLFNASKGTFDLVKRSFRQGITTIIVPE
jgi:hypothetical protein